MAKQSVTQQFQELFGDNLVLDQPLAKYTSARVGGSAEMFAIVRTADELQASVELAYVLGVPYFILGGGSNILIADEGVAGLVIQNRAKQVRFRNIGYSVICTAESGMNVSSLARQCIHKGLGGLEWAVSVPGTVGGAVVGNSGAHGGDMNETLVTATIWEPGKGVRIYTNPDLKYAYRESTLKEEQQTNFPRRVVISAELELKTESTKILLGRAEAFSSHRRETQPPGATMGSMFKNPEHYYAGYLIEAAGLKGLRIGGVHVSDLHANFFINDEDASAEDMRALLAEVWHSVHDQFGVKMEPEIELVGNWHFFIEDSERKTINGEQTAEA